MKSTTRVGQSIFAELQAAKDILENLPRGITIFGSARLRPDDPAYTDTVELARRIAVAGIPVISGGGPGIMEAANKGARLGQGPSVGLNITLPFEQQPNPFQDVELNLTFDHFAARKVTFCKFSRSFVVMPGGVGTLDELFEIATLLQCGKVPCTSIVLYGRSFWSGLLDWMRGQMVVRGILGEAELSLLTLVDTVEEALGVLGVEGAEDTGVAQAA